MPIQLYPWTLLNTSTSWSTTFTSSGTYARYLVKFSLSGLPEANDLRVELDGIDLNWIPMKDIGLDRWHYDILKDTALDGGLHEMKFTLLNQEREGVAQLCSVEVLEFGTEDEPTNDDCLMRLVTTPDFCKVCIEGLWLSLLRRVNLIDGINEGCEQGASRSSESSTSGWIKIFDLKLVPLAQFREPQSRVNESYTIKWWKDHKLLTEFTNQTRLIINGLDAIGTYLINVTFATDEMLGSFKQVGPGSRHGDRVQS
ncbi:hypothetical protein C0989_000135 [Termitomyces sp. Mn162]|nr:hypothetical protein C0989_000135 [Termitomyces sp. Mn162]